jgi:FkbM family methyltransferase
VRRYLGKLATRALKLAPARINEALLRRTLAVASEDVRRRNGHVSMFGSLRNLASAGFRPGGIVDVGAHVGEWSSAVAAIFRGCPIHMIEAQPDLGTDLAAAAGRIPEATYSIALLGRSSRPSVPFFLLDTGSSVFEELTTYPKKRVELPMRVLDDVRQVQTMAGPLLLKLDVQGAELEVLAGAEATLRKTEVILAEVSLLPYNSGAPLMHEVIAFLADRGFLPYDICSQLRRSSDGALFQTDIIFARHDSELRAQRRFWDCEPDQSVHIANAPVLLSGEAGFPSEEAHG